MFFNSFQYALFLPIVFIIYWLFYKKRNVQNFILLIASYFFYGMWDWRFLALILFSTLVDYFVGLKLESCKNHRNRKFFLYVSLAVNLGLLCVFKYFNFFIESFVEMFEIFGVKLSLSTISVILPVGISFYTFQTLSYSIDVYKRQLKPTSDILSFMCYVSFFPQLVAGPIERASNLLPQFFDNRNFSLEKATDGMRQILWGLFMKIIVADKSAVFVNEIFDNYSSYSGGILFLGAILFAFQIYGDFAGYSHIAIGTARLFGFDLMQNFAYPYFSRDIAEFWRRWHISLSSWFRDYVYIPLGGSRGSLKRTIRNVFIIFLVSGFWHGANWTFIAWGFFHALFFLPLLLIGKNRKNISFEQKGFWEGLKNLINIFITFFLVCIIWVFFRAESLNVAIQYIVEIFTGIISKQSIVELYNFVYWKDVYLVLTFIVLTIIFEWKQKFKKHALEFDHSSKTRFFRWLLYLSLILVMIVFSETEEHTFIYFQF